MKSVNTRNLLTKNIIVDPALIVQIDFDCPFNYHQSPMLQPFRWMAKHSFLYCSFPATLREFKMFATMLNAGLPGFHLDIKRKQHLVDFLLGKKKTGKKCLWHRGLFFTIIFCSNLKPTRVCLTISTQGLCQWKIHSLLFTSWNNFSYFLVKKYFLFAGGGSFFSDNDTNINHDTDINNTTVNNYYGGGDPNSQATLEYLIHVVRLNRSI